MSPRTFQNEREALEWLLQDHQRLSDFASRVGRVSESRISDVQGRVVGGLQTLERLIDRVGQHGGSQVISRGGPEGQWVESKDRGLVRIEDIPGRRIPYTVVVSIPIAGGESGAPKQQSYTVSQEGPFVASRRFIAFLSQHQANIVTGGVSTRFATRSFGRYRPPHSANDYLDGQTHVTTTLPSPFAAGTYMAGIGLPSNVANFRTMEFDGIVSVTNQGSQYPRQWEPTPTTMWCRENNAPVDLPALDFFERAETIQFSVTPTHANNPAFGNVDGAGIFGAAGWPFLNGQFDPHEGIVTPSAFTVGGGGALTRLETDPLDRLPDGIILIGFDGYRILQPSGVPR